MRNSDWLSPSEAARYVGLSVRTMRRYAAQGRVRTRRFDRWRFYDRDSLDALIRRAEGYCAPVAERSAADLAWSERASERLRSHNSTVNQKNA